MYTSKQTTAKIKDWKTQFNKRKFHATKHMWVESSLSIKYEPTEISFWDFPGGPVVMIGKLRSRMPWGQKTKTENRSNIITKFNKDFLNSLHQKI